MEVSPGWSATRVSDDDTPIEITHTDGVFTVWNPHDIRRLREQYRITGSRVGVALHPMQPAAAAAAAARGAEPAEFALDLMPEEVALLVDRGMAAVVETCRPLGADPLGPVVWRSRARAQRDRDLLYRALWDEGYHLTGGSKFGSIYLAYRGAPGEVHAEAIVQLLPPGTSAVDGLQLVAGARVSNTVRKQSIVATVSDDGAITRIVVAAAPEGWNRRLGVVRHDQKATRGAAPGAD
jgi:tRNA splicing endonuclease